MKAQRNFTITPEGVPAHEIRLKVLDTDLLKRLNAALRPTPQEVAGMIQHLMLTKKWSAGFLGAMLHLTTKEFHACQFGLKRSPDQRARLIWLLYMMDTAPAKAFSLIHYAAWGRVKATLPHYVKPITEERHKEIYAEIVACVKSGYKLHPKHKTKKEIAKLYGVSYDVAYALCRRAKYSGRDARKRTYRRKTIPFHLRPESIWMYTDWRNSSAEIARQAGIDVSSVNHIKDRFRRLHKPLLRKQILACGSKLEFFEPILNPPREYLKRMKRAAKRKARKALFAANLKAKLISENNRLTENNKPEIVTTADNETNNTSTVETPTATVEREREVEVHVRCNPAQCEAPAPAQENAEA